MELSSNSASSIKPTSWHNTTSNLLSATNVGSSSHNSSWTSLILPSCVCVSCGRTQHNWLLRLHTYQGLTIMTITYCAFMLWFSESPSGMCWLQSAQKAGGVWTVASAVDVRSIRAVITWRVPADVLPDGLVTTVALVSTVILEQVILRRKKKIQVLSSDSNQFSLRDNGYGTSA